MARLATDVQRYYPIPKGSPLKALDDLAPLRQGFDMQPGSVQNEPGCQAIENIRESMARENGSKVSVRPPGTPSTLQSKVR